MKIFFKEQNLFYINYNKIKKMNLLIKTPKKNRKNKIKMYLILIFQTVKKKKLRRLS